MKEIVALLGFDNFQGAIWNSVGYIGLFYLILGVFSERFRRGAFVTGAFWLAAYAFVFTNNMIFASMELLFSGAAMMQFDLKLSKRFFIPVIFLWTLLICYLVLFSGLEGSIDTINNWHIVGITSFSLLVIGMVILPRSYGFFIMSIGGTLLTLYAWEVSAWVFFILNVFFVGANLYGGVKAIKTTMTAKPA